MTGLNTLFRIFSAVYALQIRREESDPLAAIELINDM